MRNIAFLSAALVVLTSQACGTSIIGDGSNEGGATGLPLPAEGGNGPLVQTITQAKLHEVSRGACTGESLKSENRPSKLELVVDISGSMDNPAPGNSVTKWVATREALREAIVGVDGLGLPPDTAVGLLFYPGFAIDTVSKISLDSSVPCLNLEHSVAMAKLDGSGSAQRLAIGNALDAVATGQGTPTHDAYAYALNSVVNSVAQLAIEGTPYLLLITDGMPTLEWGCFNKTGELDFEAVPTQPIIDEVARAYSRGIKTFIIGSPGSQEGRGKNGYDWLSAAAQAGGTASTANCSDNGPVYCHLDMTTAKDFSAALRDGLTTVTAALTSCKFSIPATSSNGSQVVDPKLVYPVVTYSSGTIELFGRDLGRDTCVGEGFRMLSDSAFELCETSCGRLLADSGATVDLLFGCVAPPTTLF